VARSICEGGDRQRACSRYAAGIVARPIGVTLTEIKSSKVSAARSSAWLW